MTILYGIKNCDTVKKARQWLDKQQIDYRFHDFRSDGLSASQISHWIATIGLDTLVNKRSTTWKELDQAAKDGFNEHTAVALIVAHPTLIKRPLLETGNSAQVGFKADSWQALLIKP